MTSATVGTRLQATAVDLVRSTLRIAPNVDPDGVELTEWARRIEALDRGLNRPERVRLIGLLAQVGAALARELPVDRRETFFALLAGLLEESP